MLLIRRKYKNKNLEQFLVLGLDRLPTPKKIKNKNKNPNSDFIFTNWNWNWNWTQNLRF